MSNLRFPSDPLAVLQYILGLHSTDPSSPPLDSQLEIREVGVSMLDTRDLTPTKNLKCHLTTKQFVVGTHKETERAARILHFGTSERVNPYASELKECIMGTLHIADQKSVQESKFRDIVLVGHGFSSDLSALRRAGIVFEDIKNIVGILDTTFIAKAVLGCGFQLGTLLDVLGIANSHLHNAGNDANFTLKALLLLSLHAFRSNLASPVLIRRLVHLKGLGLEPLPNTAKRLTILRALSKRTENEFEEDFMSSLGSGMLLFDEL